MPSVRQLASGLLYAFVSVVLVLGSLILALTQASAPSGIPPTPSRKPTTIVPSRTAAAPTSSPVASPAPSSTLTASSTGLPSLVITATRTATSSFPTVRASPRPTSAPAIVCGPFSGWVKTYVVQPGDTLFRIAVNYRTTAPRLQQANCKFDTLIYPGERLWVPAVATITPGVTIIPTFATPTSAEFDSSTPGATQSTPADP